MCAVRVQYLDNVPERYKAVKAYNAEGVQKYRMRNVGRAIERPNEALIQSIAKRFNTQQGLEPIYSRSYGVNWSAFLGRDMNHQLALDLEAEITEALKVSPFVNSVVVKVAAVGYDQVVVNVEVSLKREYTSDGKMMSIGLVRTLTL